MKLGFVVLLLCLETRFSQIMIVLIINTFEQQTIN
jgi:hypothetical protein